MASLRCTDVYKFPYYNVVLIPSTINKLGLMKVSFLVL